MKEAIFVTAVTGSGKSTVCKSLQTLGYEAVDIEEVPGLFQWKDDKTGQVVPHYHDSLKLATTASWLCDKVKLKKIIDDENSDLTFYCGAAANYNDIWGLFNRVIILQVSDQTTVQRLSSRDPDDFGHTPEVQQWVLSWKDEVEKGWLQKGAIPVEAEDSPIQVAKYVVTAATSPTPN